MSLAPEQEGTTNTMDQNEIEERLHAVEVAQATGAATLAGSQATQAGAAATSAAMHAGTIATVAAGSVSLVVGLFLGIVIRSFGK